MILIVNVCRDKLSEMEFVRPLAMLIKDHVIVHYSKVKLADRKSAEKIIIAGTALKDFDYLEGKFSWLKKTKRPVLGICAGAQVIGKEFGLKLEDFTLIGPQKVEVIKKNSLADGAFNAYFLNTKIVTGCDTLATSNGKPCMFKIPEKEIYGCLFHPEVLNESIIGRFLK
ncbi:Glutamine amidotransferase class-I [uncultured archaeon]|nr:Glutamine amidotransferase class-I [uncultured archaeon]